MSTEEAHELLNLAVVERAIAFAARRHRLAPAELADLVKRKLVENDYAILHAYDRRGSFTTYISIIVQRMALEHRDRAVRSAFLPGIRNGCPSM